MLQRKSFLCFLSLFLTFLVSTLITGCLLTQKFDARSQQSSRFVSRFVTHAILQHLARLTPGLEAFSHDRGLWKDIHQSLGKPGSRDSITALSRIEAFAREHNLEQFSLYMKPSEQKDYVRVTTVVPRDQQIFAYAPGKYGLERLALSRDKQGLFRMTEDFSHARMRFPHEFPGPTRKISLIRVEDKLYLDINHPLAVNREPGILRLALPLPDSFITKMEQETGHRISFYDAQRQYIAGILEPQVEIPDEGSFANHGTDGIDYIHYVSRVMIEGSELAKVVISLERNRLTGKIMETLFMIIGISLIIAASLAAGLGFYRRLTIKRS